jgi:hypothetical protein
MLGIGSTPSDLEDVMTRLVAAILLACGLAAAPAAPAADVSPDPKDLAIPPQEVSRARELIKKLGSEVYRDREEAHAELARMGRLARPALVEGAANDPDPEVRYRCSRLLPKAGADDLRARLETFLADADSKYEHDLPGLRQFRKHVGSDEKARALFVDVVKSPYNLELLQAVDKNPTEAGRAIADRRAQLWSQINNRVMPGGRPAQPRQIELPEIALLLFAESITPSKEIPRAGMFAYVTGVNFLQQGSAMQVINGNNNPAHADVFKKIVSRWLETREEVNDLNQLSYFAGQSLRSFPETIPLLRRIVTTEGTYGYAKGQALMHLTQIKGKEEIAFLKPLLGNDTLVQNVWFGQNGNQPVQHQCLLKDVALAYIVTLHGHNMTDFGFKFPPGVVPQPNQIGYGNFAFENEEARKIAMVRWGFLRLKHGETGAPPKKDDAAPKKEDKKDEPQPDGRRSTPPPPRP